MGAKQEKSSFCPQMAKFQGIFKQVSIYFRCV
jgi:hypothetical protein